VLATPLAEFCKKGKDEEREAGEEGKGKGWLLI